MYRLLRSILFLFPAETAHYLSMNTLKALCSVPFVKPMIASLFSVRNARLSTTLFGLTFKNPVGLGAGFDKNAKYLRELEALGFGFVEIGTVTPRPQAGNDKPRLFRLPKDKALINRMGFNNDGVAIITKRLKKWKEKSLQLAVDDSELPNPEATAVRKYFLRTSTLWPTVKQPRLMVGGNIGKNKTTPNEQAWKDYEICFRALHHYVDFFIVNVSSPNTPGLRELQEKESLKKILTHLQALNKTYSITKPILLKIAPDLTDPQIDDVIALAKEIELDGLVATNTTISREGLQTPGKQIEAIGAGGLSGRPLQQRSTQVVRYIKERAGSIPVIASGGIFTYADAREKFNTGASLIEVWTGFIYEGPLIVKRICKRLTA